MKVTLSQVYKVQNMQIGSQPILLKYGSHMTCTHSSTTSSAASPSVLKMVAYFCQKVFKICFRHWLDTSEVVPVTESLYLTLAMVY